MRYRNPAHKPGRQEYGPEFYETSAAAVEYMGALIVNRVPGAVWDVVVDGVCVTQRAGKSGAMQAIQSIKGQA